ncbi:hypothetical protein [Candidatus Cardinium hertigii]|uniref:Uncharacterized protein n=1 Tax=Candidatus Cardinium hertigii TaxID=247481 RepID=A0A2Z3LA97_9BACT|nr:hypothetical protein [Candidatus Cardinium hertigii]AWN82251.1 hypothetical protein DK880_00954 [Candidatus Cardinium hertigii]
MVTKCRAMRSTYTKGISVLLVAWSSFVLWGCNRMDMEGGRNSRSQRSSETAILVELEEVGSKPEKYYNEFVKNELDALEKMEAIMHPLLLELWLQEQENKSGKWQAIISGIKDFLLRNIPSGLGLAVVGIPIVYYLRSLSPACPLSDQNTEIDKALTDASGNLTVINFGYASRALKAICNHGNTKSYYYSDARSIFPFINETIFDPLVQKWYRACPSQDLGRGRITGFFLAGAAGVILPPWGLNGLRGAVINGLSNTSNRIIFCGLKKCYHFLDKWKEEHCLSDDALLLLKHNIAIQCKKLENNLQGSDKEKDKKKVLADSIILLDQIKKRIASISDTEKKIEFKNMCLTLLRNIEREGEANTRFRQMVEYIFDSNR